MINTQATAITNIKLNYSYIKTQSQDFTNLNHLPIKEFLAKIINPYENTLSPSFNGIFIIKVIILGA